MTDASPIAAKTALLAFHAPVRVLYGAGLAATAGAEIVGALPAVRRALVVTDSGVQEAGITERIEEALAAAGIATTTIAVAGEPTEAEVIGGAELLGEHQADIVVGVGGGSALDAGKAINVAAHNDGAIRPFEGFDQIPNPGLPFVSVPTTAGTGSEVGCGMVVADTDARRKYLIVDKQYWPALALLDPELTVSLPPRATAWSGIDALAQAMGALVVTLAHPLMEPTGLGAVRLLGRNLVTVVADGADIAARLAMQLGSALAGFAMYNAEAGLDHAFGEVVGGRFGVPHGASIAMFLPQTTAFTVPAAEEMYARIAREISPAWATLPDAAACAALIAWLEELNSRFEIPRLGAFGATSADVPELVRLTLDHFSTSINARELRSADAEAIYRGAL
jgi:alcohol dehydrogenase class IV